MQLLGQYTGFSPADVRMEIESKVFCDIDASVGTALNRIAMPSDTIVVQSSTMPNSSSTNAAFANGAMNCKLVT
jgi:hypothetical protein